MLVGLGELVVASWSKFRLQASATVMDVRKRLCGITAAPVFAHRLVSRDLVAVVVVGRLVLRIGRAIRSNNDTLGTTSPRSAVKRCSASTPRAPADGRCDACCNPPLVLD